MVISEKDADKFIKKLFDLNQHMKNIYKDEPNFSPTYKLTNFEALYADEECIPGIVNYVLDTAFITDEKIDFEVSVKSQEFFSMFKEPSSRKGLTVKIEYDSIIFESDGDVYYKLTPDKGSIHNIDDKVESYSNKIPNDDSLAIFELNEDLIKYICDNPKQLIHVILDFDENEVTLLNNVTNLQDKNYLEFFINKKFSRSISYTIKKLKSGNKVEYTPVSIYVNELTGDNNYDINLVVCLKNNDKVEHHFMIVDF